MKLWERIHEDLDQDFGFRMQDFGRGLRMKDLQDFGRGFTEDS